MIVPDRVLFCSSKAHKELRRTLVEDLALEGVMSLPNRFWRLHAVMRKHNQAPWIGRDDQAVFRPPHSSQALNSWPSSVFMAASSVSRCSMERMRP